MAVFGQTDPRADAINKARERLLLELRRADEPGASHKVDLAKAIDEFVAAKIADALDRRY